MEFFQKDLAQIVGKASSLAERLESNLLINETEINDSVVNLRLKRWCQVAAKGEPKNFEKRLAWDGLDLNTIRCVLDTVCLAEDAPLPAWAETLTAIMKATKSVSLETVEKGDKYPFLCPDQPIPFETVFVSFLEVARQKLIAQANSGYQLLSESAQVTLDRNLLKQLSNLGSQTLQAEFVTFRNFEKSTLASLMAQPSDSPSRELHKQFIKNLISEGLLSLFQKYSVLARLLATVTDFWVEAFSEFLERLAKDWSEIQQTFQDETALGQVINIQLELSDYHNSGRSVIIIEFTSGLKLVYKPRNLGLEQAYFQLIAWLNEQGLPLTFKLVKVINKSTYGWVEYVKQLPCEDEEAAKRYYQRAGIVLCLLHALTGKDCHRENLIASGEHPVLVDLEMLMQPQFRPMETQGDFGELQILVNQVLDNSVLSTGLLPNWEMGPDGRTIFDVSGLGGVGEQQMPYQIPKWHNINTDKMALGNEYGKLVHQANLPSLHGVTLSPNDYVDEIVDGFRQMYQFLLERREAILAPDSPLASLAHQELRFLFRNSRTYGVILKSAFNPKFLQNGAELSIELDILSRAFLGCDTKPYCWQLLRREKEALEQLDIPYFTTYSDRDALVISPEETIERSFHEPSYKLVISRLQQLSAQDLIQQISIIRGSLYSLVATEPRSLPLSKNGNPKLDTVAPLTRETMVQQAIAIAADLQQRVTFTADGSARWIGMEYMPKTGRLQLQLLDFGLEGSCGIALFLAALERVTGGTGYRDLALSALQLLRRILKNAKACQQLKMYVNLGAVNGFGSMLYALVKIAQFLDEPTLLEDAKRLALLVTPTDIVTDQDLDIFTGAAGAILGLLALHEVTGDSYSLEMAITCGQHLLKRRVVSETGYKTWKPVGLNKPLTGFSHGAAGIAYALLRLYQATSDFAFLEAAKEAIAYERSVFSEAAKNWPDFRSFVANDKQPSFTTSWCHGAPGIGLARLGSLKYLDSPEIRQEIDIALQTTQEFPWRGVDHLCCGNFGRVDVLLEGARRLSRPELLETVPKQIVWAMARAEQTGGFHLFHNIPQGIFHPGFFRGIAGIGYQLLRLAEPDLLPSVLLWK